MSDRIHPDDSVSAHGQADRDPENRGTIGGAATTFPLAGVPIARASATSAIEPGAFSEVSAVIRDQIYAIY